MAKATLNDIARLCGAGVSTVSGATRGDPRVKIATQQRVIEAARRLGYRQRRL